MAEFVKAADVGEIPVGQGKEVELGGQQIAVFNVDGAYYAIHNTCTHRGAPLSGGALDGNTVVCPWHGARFDVTTGRALSPPAPGNVTCYRVRVQDHSIEIEIG